MCKVNFKSPEMFWILKSWIYGKFMCHLVVYSGGLNEKEPFCYLSEGHCGQTNRLYDFLLGGICMICTFHECKYKIQTMFQESFFSFKDKLQTYCNYTAIYRRSMVWQPVTDNKLSWVKPIRVVRKTTEFLLFAVILVLLFLVKLNVFGPHHDGSGKARQKQQFGSCLSSPQEIQETTRVRLS